MEQRILARSNVPGFFLMKDAQRSAPEKRRKVKGVMQECWALHMVNAKILEKLSERVKKKTLENDVNKKPTLFGCDARIRGTGNACSSFDKILKMVWKRNPGIFSHKLEKRTSTVVYEWEERSRQGIKVSFSHHDRINRHTSLNILQKQVTSNSFISQKTESSKLPQLPSTPTNLETLCLTTHGAVLTVLFGVEATRHGNVLGEDNAKGRYRSGNRSRGRIVVQAMWRKSGMGYSVTTRRRRV
ncbi:hypothetical protein K435DRAFT_884923 [Dendrothele bispora CBS 962.96]|uniref:Uncharacterized protein n=1 Tax=Dendrothele bispora (strain CBS 962.96) TaxID=1314807 RepID=A0A4S8M849_DENBC|nr:hypothetical protein K435DRAFT_884923 [Dendrothele bispora CBS 962.96]